MCTFWCQQLQTYKYSLKNSVKIYIIKTIIENMLIDITHCCNYFEIFWTISFCGILIWAGVIENINTN